MPTKPKTAPDLHTFDSGLRLAVSQQPQAPSVAIIAMVGVGSRHESQKLSGISHFIEHMAFKGTDQRPTSLDIAAQIDGFGGEFNAFTSKEYTGYFIKSAAKDANTSLDILSDILFHSRLDATEMAKERGVILEEMSMYLDQPADRVNDLYAHILYPDQALGQDIIGTKASLNGLKQTDLAAFMQQWYVPNNMVIGMAGALTDQQITSVEQRFNQRPTATLAGFQAAQTAQTQPQLTVETKATDQTQLILGVRSYPLGHPHRYAIALLSILLGGNMSSRLFVEIREKRGLAYAVSASLDEYVDAGSLNCQIGLEHGRVEEAVEVVLDQFRLLKTDLVGHEELQRTKNYLRGRLALSLEDPLGLSLFQVRQLLLEDAVRTPDDIMTKIEAVTAEHIQQVAQEIFTTDQLNLAAIGPSVSAEKLQPLLKI